MKFGLKSVRVIFPQLEKLVIFYTKQPFREVVTCKLSGYKQSVFDMSAGQYSIQAVSIQVFKWGKITLAVIMVKT